MTGASVKRGWGGVGSVNAVAGRGPGGINDMASCVVIGAAQAAAALRLITREKDHHQEQELPGSIHDRDGVRLVKQDPDQVGPDT